MNIEVLKIIFKKMSINNCSSGGRYDNGRSMQQGGGGGPQSGRRRSPERKVRNLDYCCYCYYCFVFVFYAIEEDNEALFAVAR